MACLPCALALLANPRRGRRNPSQHEYTVSTLPESEEQERMRRFRERYHRDPRVLAATRKYRDDVKRGVSEHDAWEEAQATYSFVRAELEGRIGRNPLPDIYDTLAEDIATRTSGVRFVDCNKEADDADADFYARLEGQEDQYLDARQRKLADCESVNEHRRAYVRGNLMGLEQNPSRRSSAMAHRKKHRRHCTRWSKSSRRSGGKKYIRFGGHKVSWKGLVGKKGVMGAKKIWRKAKKLLGRGKR